MNGARVSAKQPRLATSAAPKRPGSVLRAALRKVFQLFVSSNMGLALTRRIVVWTVFLLVIGRQALNADPAGWSAHTQAIFVGFFVDQNPLSVLLALLALIVFAAQILFTPDVLRPLILLLAPYLLALQFVAIYLQDIFELEHVEVARRYILQSALGAEYDRIHIRSGSIDPKQLDSPLIQIGGPGWVQVELDSAALFETADGSTRVIGPTVAGMHYAFIRGFERLREVIDLREMTTDAMTMNGRSRDGIPVVAKDVRLVYSVQRGNQKASMEKPYPFVDEAIQQLVFQQTSTVTSGGPKYVTIDDYWKQTYKRWSGTMPGLIQSALSEFVSEHNLSEFLANIGKIELEAIQRLENAVRQTGKAAAGSIEDTQTLTKNQSEVDQEALKFTPRTDITNLFYDFTSGFPKRAENRGVQLGWIGVGTWGTPASAQLISENHLEAWRISRENYLRGHPQTLEHLREDARVQELQNLIHRVILLTYQKASDEDLPPETIAQKLMLAYREQVKAAWDISEREREKSPEAAKVSEALTKALRILNGFLSHKVNKKPAEPPPS